MDDFFYTLDMKIVALSEDELELQLHTFFKKETVKTSSRVERLRYQ